jgi:hypothetical protein
MRRGVNQAQEIERGYDIGQVRGELQDDVYAHGIMQHGRFYCRCSTQAPTQMTERTAIVQMCCIDVKRGVKGERAGMPFALSSLLSRHIRALGIAAAVCFSSPHHSLHGIHHLFSSALIIAQPPLFSLLPASLCNLKPLPQLVLLLAHDCTTISLSPSPLSCPASVRVRARGS